MSGENKKKPFTIQDVENHLKDLEMDTWEKLKRTNWIKKIKRWIGRNKNGMGKQDYIDCEMMRANIAQLKKFAANDQKKIAFAEFYESTLVGSFVRYRSSKHKTWGFGHNLVLLIATLALSVLPAAVLARLDAAEGVLADAPVPVFAAAAVVCVLSAGYTKWHEMKNDKETWVRHSVCYNRLNLLLQQFILSKRSDVDYDSFVQNTFSILDQNLDQFALNMSGNGLAERPEVQPKKDD